MVNQNNKNKNLNIIDEPVVWRIPILVGSTILRKKNSATAQALLLKEIQMEIIKTRMEHKCGACGDKIPEKTNSLMERVDCGSYAGREYYCKKCAMVILKELTKELRNS